MSRRASFLCTAVSIRDRDDVKIARPDLFSRVCNLAICDRKVNAPLAARLITCGKCACVRACTPGARAFRECPGTHTRPLLVNFLAAHWFDFDSRGAKPNAAFW